MYQVSLTQSYFPAHGGPEPAPQSIGNMLRASVSRHPSQPALKALDYDGAILRSWSYAELLFDAERLSPSMPTISPNGSCWNSPAAWPASSWSR